MNIKINCALLVSLSALCLAACGGSGSYDSTPNVSNSGVGGAPNPSGSGITWTSITECPSHRATSGIEGGGAPSRSMIKGVIDRLEADGAVVVDGVQYSTDNASVVVNGSCAEVTDLQLGHVVTVIGEVDSQTNLGTADRIVSDDDVAGAILALDVDHETLNVIGQNIVVTAETVFGDTIRPASLATLGLREQVAVSGRVDSDGVIVATRIDRWPANSGWQASGIASLLDESNGVFHLNRSRCATLTRQSSVSPRTRFATATQYACKACPFGLFRGFLAVKQAMAASTPTRSNIIELSLDNARRLDFRNDYAMGHP